MSDLGAWLTQIWDEQEGLAKAVPAYAWRWSDLYEVPSADGAHMDRHSPAVVLARIAADRKILEIHSPDPRDPDVCTTCGEPLEYTVTWPCETARTLALPYAAEPGYREEWKP